MVINYVTSPIDRNGRYYAHSIKPTGHASWLTRKGVHAPYTKANHTGTVIPVTGVYA